MIILYLVIGGIAGWLVGMYLKEHGYGLYADIAIGVLGGLIGAWLVGEIGLPHWVVGIIASIIGAIVLVYIVRTVQRAATESSPS